MILLDMMSKPWVGIEISYEDIPWGRLFCGNTIKKFDLVCIEYR